MQHPYLCRVLHAIHPNLPALVELTRLHRPVGFLILMWPTLMALFIAADGQPSLGNLFIFTLGTILMRSAGCVLNDLADKDFDGHVERTRNRPLARGALSPELAKQLFAVLAGVSFVLVLFTNIETIALSILAVGLAAVYPFMKRVTQMPQLVLGLAFSWGILMAFTAEAEALPLEAWLIFLFNLLWTIAYDTYYAMTDREDDLKIGIKSTAILFGMADRAIILSLQMLALVCLAAAGATAGLTGFFWIGLLVAAWGFIQEFRFTANRDPQSCFRAFNHNSRMGFWLLVGTILGSIPVL